MANENISRIVSDYESQLSGAIAVGATSFTIQSVLDLDGNTLSDGIYAFTIDRDSTGAKEYLIGQLTASTKTVSSISSVGRQGALTANAQRSHRIGANVIISDHSILAAISRIFTGVGTINPAAPLAYTSAPTLSSATELATKGYVDGVVTGGTVNTDRIILGSQTAGETVAAGNIVYFKSSDSRWWLADADLTATFQNVQLGVALGSGTAGNAITGGVLIYGKCDSFTGLTATATYYLSNTAGAVATSAGTNEVIIGQAFSTTGIFVNPGSPTPFFVTTSAGAGDSGKVPKLGADGQVDRTFVAKHIKFGGTGADSALAITSGATNIDLAGAQVVTKNYTSISITGTGSLTFTNPHANGTIIILKSQGNVTLTSSATPMIDLRLLGGSKGNGAVGSTGVAGDGGRGGGSMYIECAGSWNFTTTNGINTSGANGVTPTGTNSMGGGGGGGGGIFYAIYNTLIANTGTVVVSGGTGGTAIGGSIAGSDTATNGTSAISQYLIPGGGRGVAGGSGAGATAPFAGCYNSIYFKDIRLAPGSGGGGGGPSSGGTRGGGGGASLVNSGAGNSSGDGGAGGNGYSLVALNTEFA